MRELIVNYPDYHRTPVKPLSFEAFCDMYETHGRVTGLWRILQTDAKSGEIVREVWNPNVITDNGAVNLLASAIAAASNANPWDNLLITNNDGSTTLTTALTNGQTGVVSLAVAAVPAAIPSGSTLQLGYGTGQTQNVTTSSLTAQGATAIAVTSFTSNAAYGIGTNVVPVPQVTDNPANAALTSNATVPLSQYSGNLVAGAFTYANTTGPGNRSVTATFTFKVVANGGTTTAGSYTSCWLVNVASGATNTTSGLFVGNYLAHEINNPMACNSANNISPSVQIKL